MKIIKYNVMKKLLFILLLFSSISYSQRVVINNNSYIVEGGIMTYDDKMDQGMSISPVIKSVNNKVAMTDIVVLTIGMGCSGKLSTLYLYYDDGSFDKLVSNNYNCQGKSIFKIKDYSKLLKLKVKHIKFVNSYNGSSIESDMNEFDENYFLIIDEDITDINSKKN